MSHFQLQTPIIFMIFKRPDTTQKVFEAIRQAKPSKLLVIADGPRPDRPEELEQCTATREIIEQVDWECEVLKNYSEQNLGCRKRIPSGLNWAFEQVEEAIILEDDCLPHPTFFRFCQEMLDYYRHDTRIGSISGDNTPLGYRRTNDSYYFSIYNRCWGWATWKRVWKNYDVDMKQWPLFRDNNWLRDILLDDYAVKVWTNIFNSNYDNLNVWDYQFMFSLWIQGYLNIIPNVNLVSNIGFGEGGTNTFNSEDTRANVPTQSMNFPIEHPPFLIRDTLADAFTQKNVYNPYSFPKRIKTKLKKIFKA
ncbi:glycosyltransferase family 2 protein [Anabaena sphaerica FACHB-251]|uniref:Glycosyltransferase family 2 protein n=1 Tax=Anabaena sphaerica FACHB-251 TaxID=2692883 RepID=A0A927A396_9NOST|nr:glycosyltransferase family 2 protein [Anabaena sphaerica]MBD2295926.1 glycosyltransferase family 2 protein [Anabaena sphaerica FACHB-251]